jgi:hypothetical protein
MVRNPSLYVVTLQISYHNPCVLVSPIILSERLHVCGAVFSTIMDRAAVIIWNSRYIVRKATCES